ncbi:MAG: 4-hydroxy-tetrahydrodipicolinate reductase [Elusimicrobia bacterium]|nr:4-hydroxy-tetrahydrodipicolinate reductase [Elusimicrobiota bacterium]
MLRISVSGAKGRMGTSVCRIIKADPGLTLAGCIEAPGHNDISAEIDGVRITSDIKEGIKDADVVIDFSTVENGIILAEACAKNRKRLVIGTTGFDLQQTAQLELLAKKTPLLLSPNMSLGVNLVFKMIKEITDKLPGYEKEIVEAHHNRKVDAPSGTALMMAKMMSREGDRLVFGREGKTGPRQPNEIGVHAVRGGSIVGEHTAMWIGEHERIELTHKSQSREVLSYGAVQAAVWLAEMEPGRLYSIQDMLK